VTGMPGRPRRERYGSSELLGPDESLRAELLELAAEQRETVHLGSSDDPAERLAWRAVTTRQADRLTTLLDAVGWPSADAVGPEAVRAAWLVALHADQRLDLQRRAVELLATEVGAGRVPAVQQALLEDRMRVNSGLPQRYGTQIVAVRDGVPVPWPIEDPDQLDERRAAVGLEPWQLYVESHRDG
jgi:hypothetical protein